MIEREMVTIIIPHLGANDEQEQAIGQCVSSLHDSVLQSKKIIITNGSHCKVNHALENCSTMNLSEQGQCKAVNAAVATTNTRWIFITNDDMVYAPGWWERLQHLSTEPACVSPQLVEPKPGAPTFIVQDFGGIGNFQRDKWLDFFKNRSMEMDNYRTGFNLPLLIRRDLWDLIGGYDINYDPWGSNGDSDLEYKIRLAGVQPYQNTNCLVYHFSQTSGTFEPQNDVYRFENYAYFKEKWGFDRTDEGIWEANFKMPEPPTRKFIPKWENTYEN